MFFQNSKTKIDSLAKEIEFLKGTIITLQDKIDTIEGRIGSVLMSMMELTGSKKHREETLELLHQIDKNFEGVLSLTRQCSSADMKKKKGK